jgi:hypothetical protein
MGKNYLPILKESKETPSYKIGFKYEEGKNFQWYQDEKHQPH